MLILTHGALAAFPLGVPFAHRNHAGVGDTVLKRTPASFYTTFVVKTTHTSSPAAAKLAAGNATEPQRADIMRIGRAVRRGPKQRKSVSFEPALEVEQPRGVQRLHFVVHGASETLRVHRR